MYIGVDLGGTAIKAGLVDDNGTILHKGSAPTRAKAGYQAIVSDIADLINKVLEESNTSIKDIKSIGMGAPGSIDSKNGVIIYLYNSAL